MTIELLPTFKTQAILDVHNHLAAAQGKPTLADWSKAKTELVARIMKLGETSDIEAAIKATESDTKPGKKPVEKKANKKAATKAVAKTNGKAPAKAKADGEKPVRKATGVGAFIRETLVGTPDMSALDVLSLVQKKFPEAKTSISCVGWYRSQMYKSGELTRG